MAAHRHRAAPPPRRRRSALDRVLSGFGELLITVGIVVALFLVWQLWWTGIAANRVSRVPVKVKRTGSPNWYAPTMVTLMVIGLLWVVATYLFQGKYPLPYFRSHHEHDWLANGNLYVGFLIMMLGFLGLLRWK